jgi:hypothetical protein
LRYLAHNFAFTAIVTIPVMWIARQAGLDWGLAIVVAISVLAVLWWLLSIQIGVRKRSRYDVEHAIKIVLVTRENGSWLEVRHRASPITFKVVRASGDDSSAEVVITVPRASWSQPKSEDLVRMFESQGLSYTTEPTSFTQESSLIEARVSVPYIWEGSVGAEPARVAHLILDTFSVGPGELLDLRLEGAPSDRYKQHRVELADL